MTISIHGTLTNECQIIKAGTVWRLFDAKCGTVLKRFPEPDQTPNPLARFLAAGHNQIAMTSLQGTTGLSICNVDDPVKPYLRPGFLLRQKVRLHKKCIFEKPLGYIIRAQYSEATNPVNTVYSNEFVYVGEWDAEAHPVEQHIDLFFDSIGDVFHNPFNPVLTSGSSGTGRARITLGFTDFDPSNPCSEATTIDVVAELQEFGLPIDWFAGGSPIEFSQIGCTAFRDGHGVANGWTGVNFFAGPIGLVMQILWSVHGLY